MTDDKLKPQYLAMRCDDMPTSCVNFGVVDTLTGKEVCRVWDEGDCRTIADLLNQHPATDTQVSDERFLEAYVSKDCKIVGIDHPTDADFQDVLAAHITLRDRMNERIAEQTNCPFHTPTPDTQVSKLEKAIHENGPVVVDWMGEQLAWRPLDYGTWAALDGINKDQK